MGYAWSVNEKKKLKIQIGRLQRVLSGSRSWDLRNVRRRLVSTDFKQWYLKSDIRCKNVEKKALVGLIVSETKCNFSQ